MAAVASAATRAKPRRVEAANRPQLTIHTTPDVRRIPQLSILPPDTLRDIMVVAKILPFRVNGYVIEQLIDWRAVPDDPIFRLVFPDRAMLDAEDFERMSRCLERGESIEQQQRVAFEIRSKLNPHPADQLLFNRPWLDNQQLGGIQHKYRETVLFFPSDGQTCHSYCSFCFRWAQFVGDKDLRIAMGDRELLRRYLVDQPDVSDVLVTGGDAFTIKARRLRHFLEPLVQPELRHVRSVRFGTKALSFWPHRFLTDPDSEELIDLIKWLADHGKHVAVMAHYNHWRELTPVAEEAIARLRGAGAVIRTQGPLLRGINDSPAIWSKLWRRQSQLGMVPYYMFLARDTGPHDYFDVPLARAWEIFREAASEQSGLARTVRGPSMSTSPGKIEISGVAEVAGERVFVLRFLQSRNANWSFRPFFARYDEAATWIDDLKPAFGEAEFFFESEQLALTELAQWSSATARP